MNISLDDVRIERLTRKFLDDELEAAHQSIEHTYPWMEWCDADLTREELEGVFISIEEAWEQGDHYAFAILGTTTNAFLGTWPQSHQSIRKDRQPALLGPGGVYRSGDRDKGRPVGGANWPV